ncbi:MAG: two-component system response regulator [delta proteobacterium ML8_F1]|nr:MAG: two-component system response regulator [delta proteobacterium ML8_F1]
MKKHILVVEDDSSIGRLIKPALNKNGYLTTILASGEEALLSMDHSSFDAAILDIVLPGMDGLEILRRIREHPQYKALPVIMLTSKDSEIETVLGLEMGADDYLFKPVRYHELLTRLKKLIARSSYDPRHRTSHLFPLGIQIDLESRIVTGKKGEIPLTYLEFELLSLLANHPGRVFTRDNLLDTIWHEDQFNETRTVDVHIRRLRKKLEENDLHPDIIETVRGVGYRFASR